MTREFIPRFDLYGELEVAPTASVGAIESAYRTLVKQHHPDIAAGDDARIKRLNVAREWLTDPVLRRRYDASLPRGSILSPAGPGDAEPSPSFGPNANLVRQFLADLRGLDRYRARQVWDGRAVAHAQGYSRVQRAAANTGRSQRKAEWLFAREAAAVVARGELGDGALTDRVLDVVADISGALVVYDLLPRKDVELLLLPWTWRGRPVSPPRDIPAASAGDVAGVGAATAAVAPAGVVGPTLPASAPPAVSSAAATPPAAMPVAAAPAAPTPTDPFAAASTEPIVEAGPSAGVAAAPDLAAPTGAASIPALSPIAADGPPTPVPPVLTPIRDATPPPTAERPATIPINPVTPAATSPAWPTRAAVAASGLAAIGRQPEPSENAGAGAVPWRVAAAAAAVPTVSTGAIAAGGAGGAAGASAAAASAAGASVAGASAAAASAAGASAAASSASAASAATAGSVAAGAGAGTAAGAGAGAAGAGAAGAGAGAASAAIPAAAASIPVAAAAIPAAAIPAAAALPAAAAAAGAVAAGGAPLWFPAAAVLVGFVAIGGTLGLINLPPGDQGTAIVSSAPTASSGAVAGGATPNPTDVLPSDAPTTGASPSADATAAPETQAPGRTTGPVGPVVNPTARPVVPTPPGHTPAPTATPLPTSIPTATAGPTPTTAPTPTPTPSPTPTPTATPNPTPTAAICTVVNFFNDHTNVAQQEWNDAGFTGTVFFNPPPPQFGYYHIRWQSIPAGSHVSCSSNIVVGNFG